MVPTPNPYNGLILPLFYIKATRASMAKLVRRHTSNVEIIGSNPIGSNFLFEFTIYFKVTVFPSFHSFM